MFQPKIPMYIAVRLERFEGTWLPLPATREELKAALESIGVVHHSVNIPAYHVRVPGLYRGLLLETPLARVNFLAARLQKLDGDALLKLCAIIDSDRHFTDVEQFISYTYSHGQYRLYPDVHSKEDLGRMYLQGEDFAAVPAHLKACIHPGILGGQIASLQDGQFTALGYLTSETRWEETPKKRKTPAALDLRDSRGEDMYGVDHDPIWSAADWVPDDDDDEGGA